MTEDLFCYFTRKMFQINVCIIDVLVHSCLAIIAVAFLANRCIHQCQEGYKDYKGQGENKEKSSFLLRLKFEKSDH